jgi:hypothetical protein
MPGLSCWTISTYVWAHSRAIARDLRLVAQRYLVNPGGNRAKRGFF